MTGFSKQHYFDEYPQKGFNLLRLLRITIYLFSDFNRFHSEISSPLSAGIEVILSRFNLFAA
jgi:hypothetical protein